MFVGVAEFACPSTSLYTSTLYSLRSRRLESEERALLQSPFPGFGMWLLAYKPAKAQVDNVPRQVRARRVQESHLSLKI